MREEWTTVSLCDLQSGPVRFPCGFDEEDSFCRELKTELLQQIVVLRQQGVTQFLVACDCGIGLYAAEGIDPVRETDPDLMLLCTVPYEEQAAKWAPYLRERYFDMLAKCTCIDHAADPGQEHAQLLAYRHIIDLADLALTVFDEACAPRRARMCISGRKNIHFRQVFPQNGAKVLH